MQISPDLYARHTTGGLLVLGSLQLKNSFARDCSLGYRPYFVKAENTWLN
jgi:hypothetical protein